VIYTIGHSTHPAARFLALLEAHQIEQIADVRTIPMSRRHPQFNGPTLEAFLGTHRIRYQHMPGLGGLRKPRPDSKNTGWKHAGLRGYADYMGSDAFQENLQELRLLAGSGATAVMCAEAVWWKCHRRLLADALQVHGAPVWHIMTAGPPKAHELSDFARIHQGKVIYPGLL
jgi:uncharacterized protein (DUF488 family)